MAFWGAMFVFGVGCTSHYVPKPGVVELSGFSKGNNPSPINIINDQKDSNEITIGQYGLGTVVGNMRTWTDSAVDLAKRTLEKQGVAVSPSSPKYLKFKVTEAKVDSAGGARCKISLKVETGEGYSQAYEKSDTSLNPPWACDKTMSSVINSLFQDKTVLEYLKK
jgi:hypothetical protein